MNDENYDVSISDFELSKNAKSSKHLSKIFVTPPNESLGIEAFNQLLPPMMKLGRIFRIRKNRVDFPKTGMLLRQLSNVALVPLVKSSTEISDTVKFLFGEALYKRMMYNYVFPRKIVYKNPYIPGSKKIIKMNQVDQYVAFKNKYLPSLTQQPSYMIKNLKNTVFDFTDILKETLPNREMCMRPAVMKTSENLILQTLMRICFSASSELTPLYSTYSSTLPPVSDNFKSIIIPFKITTTDKRLANIWINPDFKINSLILKRNPVISSHLGILKFVIGLLDNDSFEGNPLAADLARRIKNEDHVVFIFHNDTHAFYIDYSEFKEKNFKFDSIFRYIRTSLKLLISLNLAEISSDEVDTLEQNMLNSPDDSSSVVEETVDTKLNGASNFQKEILNAAKSNIHENTNTSKIAKIDFNTKNQADSTLLNFINKKEDSFDDTSTLELLAKAQDKMNKQIELGFTSKQELASQKQTEVSALTDAPAKLAKVNNFVRTVRKFEEDDSESEPDWGDEEDETSPEVQDSINEDAEDEYDESEDENEEDDSDTFMEEEQKKNSKNTTTAIINSVREGIEGKITEKQKAYYDSIKDKYKSIKFDEDETLEDVLKRANTIAIDTTDAKLNLNDTSFNTSILTDFTKSYAKKSLAQDIIANVKSFSDENKSNQMAITSFEKQDISDQFNSIERYKFELKDKYGKTHHINFKLPKIDDDGFMFLGGNTKMIKKQWVLKPVTKTTSDEVYLMSNYNKVRIFRVGKNINKDTISLSKFLKEICANQDAYVKDITVYRGNNSKLNLEYDTTIEYDELAANINKIVVSPKDISKKVVFYFSQKEIADRIKEDGYNFDFNSTRMPYALKPATKEVYSIDTVKTVSTESVALNLMNTIKFDCSPEVVQLLDKSVHSTKGDSKKIYSRIEVQSKEVPLIVFLSAIFGYKKVLETGNIKTVFVKTGTHKKELEESYSKEDLEIINSHNTNTIKFMDGILYYSPYPIESAMLLNGLCELDTESFEYSELEDNLGIFIEYTYDKFKTRNLIKGWIAFRDLFLDPKTLEVINALHLPTDLCELILYANSLLQNNHFTPSGEVESWRIRDYEILSDLLYQSISENYRKYMMKGKSREGFSIPEEDILTKLNKCFILVNYDTTSPGSEMREKSSVTFKGPNGINMDRAFTLDKRGQTLSNVGTVAIAAPDNGNVGITKQLTANPRIINTLGFVEPTKTPEEAKKLSSSSLYAFEECVPYGQYNDPKRIGFLSSQTKHLVPGLAFDVPMTGTGMERAMPYKVSSVFGYKAKKDGKVIKLDEANKYILVKYDDGTTDRIDFGGKYVKNSDFFLANNIEVDVKEGQSIKEGQILTHNKDYFKKSMGRLIYTQGCLARVAMHEGEVTEDDSSAVSWRLSKKLSTTIIKRKQIVLNHNANIVSYMKVGDKVTFGDPLMYYEDAKDSDADMALLKYLGDIDEDTLNEVSRHAAEANYSGVIHDMKVYWTLDPELMGESVKKFVKQYINKIKAEIKEEEAATGVTSKRRKEIQVSVPLGVFKDRLNGILVPKEGCVIIEYYIEHVADRRPGDKVALMPALKTVINKVMDKDECAYRLNSKSKFNTIDFIQSTVGVLNRMCCSTFLNGYLSKIMFERGKEIANEFLEETK